MTTLIVHQHITHHITPPDMCVYYSLTRRQKGACYGHSFSNDNND